ncbi:sulfurtransferase TusA family protein [Pseudoruegeria sp. HB172150]|uniref:sulfurtransferase TusA family protein n=1 Tax=Pseudoruegeria sp. HB172150 TaxID=2721164 RepID=UPI00155401F2|nr:sulfurtransferase TusA family protein [Pseudoruegeria sp. HB172150]
MDHDAFLDARGLICPLPVLKLRKRLQPLEPGQVLEVHADDPVALIDIPHFCQEAGHALAHHEMRDTIQVYLIRKGG